MSKILYVEDNFLNYRLVMRMLQAERNGYELSHAEDGKSALTMVGKLKPDLILMDINLPDIDGLEVTRRIKADPALKHVPVVALTANAMVGDRERYLAGGCDDYLGKPVSRATLRAALDRFLGGAGPHGNGPEAQPAGPERPAGANASQQGEAKPPCQTTPDSSPSSSSKTTRTMRA